MHALQLTLIRFLLAYWCGASTLFVVTSIREVTSSLLTDEVKSVLPQIRFPLYYLCGFVTLGLTLLLVLMIAAERLTSRMRRLMVIAALAAVLLAMTGDYFFIYSPLRDMLQAGEIAGERFDHYHELSKYVNAAELLVCYSVGLLVAWPARERH